MQKTNEREKEQSPPSRRRGLKKEARKLKIGQKVASFAEAWIEKTGKEVKNKRICRLLRGGVD